MPQSCLWHPEHCSCAGTPPRWKLPIPLGAVVDRNLAGLEGLVPELCPSPVPGLPQDLLRGVEGRELWPSAGSVSMGSHGAPASSTRTRAPLLLHQTPLGETPGVGADGKGVQIEGKNKPGRKADPGVSEAWLPIGAGSGCPAGQRPWLQQLLQSLSFPTTALGYQLSSPPGSTRHGRVGKVLSRACGSFWEQGKDGTEEPRVRTAPGWLHAGTWG